MEITLPRDIPHAVAFQEKEDGDEESRARRRHFDLTHAVAFPAAKTQQCRNSSRLPSKTKKPGPVAQRSWKDG